MITPEEKVETARVLLNGTVNRLRRERGLHELGNTLTIGDAVSALSSMRDMPTRIHHTEGDEILRAMARWHPACLLSLYLTAPGQQKSDEFLRDYDKFGVYVIIELTANGMVPRFVQAAPVYVGMSAMLSQRLRMHATGRKSNPAEHVTLEYFMREGTEDDLAAYLYATDEEQREIRQLCMRRRRLWVRTAHTASLSDAQKLEKAMIRLYEGQGIQLWNKIMYKTTPPFI